MMNGESCTEEHEKQQLKGENQELKGTVKSIQNTMNELESEKQSLQTQNENLQNELDKNIHEKIFSMVQMALEFGMDEASAIQKTAENCNMSVEDVKKVWEEKE